MKEDEVDGSTDGKNILIVTVDGSDRTHGGGEVICYPEGLMNRMNECS